MRQKTGSAWACAGLAVLATVLLSASDARAAGVSGFGRGIIITGGNPTPVGDPAYDYALNLVLSAGSTLETGGYITIYDIPYLAGTPLTHAPNIQWGATSQYLGLTPLGYTPNPPDDPAVYNVTFGWNGPSLTAGATDLELGVFTIGRTIDLSSPPTPTLQYVATLDGTNASNAGTVQITVPEPASIVMLLIGSAVLPVSAAFRRRRRR